ncbi:F-box and associated interaction domains-containing protein [Rhynchospora pubera]|uniref:F-box and associated interaction domains-containing protein n=1 Tax=Rhynchospora pubera TaxID=906938 RepID=A0AAV8G2U9_9POAL|nr:F-box and associated interaction domains-containing protein [Rhynchospora pubera]
MSISRDEQERTLWIGNLPYWADEKYLCLCFYHFNAVPHSPLSEHVKIIRNKQTGCSSGYGFLTFETRMAAEKILHLYNGLVTMPGTKIRFCLNWAFYKSEATTTQYTSDGSIKSSYYPRFTPVQHINHENETPHSSTLRLSTIADIPLDLIEDIMLRLPAKSIVRCRRACKAWASLTCAPDFISKHLENQRSLSDAIVALGRTNDKQYNTYFFSNYNMEAICCFRTMHFEFPYGFNRIITSDSYGISNSCNGLLCIYYKSFASVVNPTTQETVQLPKSSLSSFFTPLLHHTLSIGLAYDDCSDTYKIVRMIMDCTCIISRTTRYEVMILGGANCSWRRSGRIIGYHVVGLIPPVFVHGSIYWVASDRFQQKAILCFDVRTETVCLLSTPVPTSVYSLTVLEECLGIFRVHVPLCPTSETNLYVLADNVKCKQVKKQHTIREAVYCEWVQKHTIRGLSVSCSYPVVNYDGKIFFTSDLGDYFPEQYYDTKSGSCGRRTFLSKFSRRLIETKSIRVCAQSLVSPISYLQRSNNSCPVFHLFGQRWATVFPTNSPSRQSPHY